MLRLEWSKKSETALRRGQGKLSELDFSISDATSKIPSKAFPSSPSWGKWKTETRIERGGDA